MRIIKKAVKVLMCVALILVVAVIISGYLMFANAVDTRPITEVQASIRERDTYTYLEDIPDIYQDAVLAVEDHRFYQHRGVDLIGISRAAWHDLLSLKLVEGGSTITQQLAKNLYFTQEKRFERKIAEVFTAFYIERKLEKDEILELYINSIYYGDGYYSIEEASIGYFGKEPYEMNSFQCTMLAGIPNAPSAYSPTKNYELALQRQNQVLYKMVKYGYLSQDDVNKIIAEQY